MHHRLFSEQAFRPFPGGWFRGSSGQFIEMSELLPERLFFCATVEDSDKGQGKKKLLTSILDWVQCFKLIYGHSVSKAARKSPRPFGLSVAHNRCLPEFKGDYWMGYNRRFRQRAAVVAQVDKRANIDITLWSLAFASNRATTRCKFCFSTSHDSNNCALMSNTQVPASPPRSWRPPTKHEYSSRRCVCFEWNESPSLNCSRPNCVYEHICYLCYQDPSVSNKYHKARQCAKWKPVVMQRPAHLISP